MNILIVDDEAPARARLRQQIDDLGEHAVVGEADHGAQALRMVEELSPDVVLMDIRMPGMDGVEAARHLSRFDAPPAVIFATAYNEYAIDAFDAQAIGYLMKPVRLERLRRALEHAQRLTQPQVDALANDEREPSVRSHLSARVREELRLIPVEDIRYLQADQKYVTVGLPAEEILIDDSLKSLETEFGSEVFFRVHRNALIAVRHLRGVEKTTDGNYQVSLMDCERTLAVSRRHVAPLRKLIRGG